MSKNPDLIHNISDFNMVARQILYYASSTDTHLNIKTFLLSSH